MLKYPRQSTRALKFDYFIFLLMPETRKYSSFQDLIPLFLRRKSTASRSLFRFQKKVLILDIAARPCSV